MKLRAKTLTIVASTLVFLMVLLYGASRSLLMAGFSKVENEDTERNVKRVIDAFNENINNLSVKSSDWAKWDDTYKFIVDGNQEYVASNLTDQSLADLKLNIMLFIDSTGKVMFERGYDQVKQIGIPIDPVIKKFILADKGLVKHQSKDEITAGFLIIPGGPVCIISRPILTSEGKGPIHGTIVFGKNLDSLEVKRLGSITHLALSIMDINSTGFPNELFNVKSRDHTPPIYIKPLNIKEIAGYTIIKDIHEKPMLVAKIEMPRDIYKQGYLTRIYLLIAIFIAGIIFGIIIIVLLEKAVLSRVAKLTGDVKVIGESGSNSTRVGVGGKDELSNLAGSINGMLDALEKSEQLIRERNREMRLIMNTIPTGLFSLDENFLVNPEYSMSIEQILGKVSLAGKDIFNVLNIDNSNNTLREDFINFLEIFRDELLSEKELAELNPLENIDYVRDDEIRNLNIRFHLIKRDDSLPKHFLVVVADVTEEKKLAQKIAQSEQENLQLKAIAEDPDLFRDFLSEMKQITRHAEESLCVLEHHTESRSLVNEIFRDVHTIKGTAGSFGLSAVSEIAGNLEDSLSVLRKSGEITNDIIDKTKSSLASLTRAILSVVEGARKILGDEIGDSTDIYIRISIDKLKKELAALKELIKNELVDIPTSNRLQAQIESQFRMLSTVPAHKGLAKALRIVPSLLKKMDKNIKFELIGADVLLDCEMARELNTPLVHLIRNSFDHGIESPEDRLLQGKSEEGHINLRVLQKSDKVIVQISDDGKGIDPEHLKKVAIEKGIITKQDADLLTKDEAISLIFRPGFSTCTEVNEISGRGVGMDAVIESVHGHLKGKLIVDSEIGKGTTFTIEIPNYISDDPLQEFEKVLQFA